METSITTPTNNILATALNAHRAKTNNQLGQPSKDAPHILIIGKTGTGKSRSIKTLPSAETVIINVEEKTLPFDNAASFKDSMATGFEYSLQVDECLKRVVDIPSVKYIVIDSFTKWQEMLMVEERAKGGGWEIMNRHNLRIHQLFQFIKKVTNKIIIFTARDEISKLDRPDGSSFGCRTAKCEGRWSGGNIESEFSIVLFTEILFSKVGTEPKREYKFVTNNDNTFTAKSPEGLFPYHIPNDLGEVVKATEKYFNIGC